MVLDVQAYFHISLLCYEFLRRVGGFSEEGVPDHLDQRWHRRTFNSCIDLTVLTIVITVVTLKEQVQVKQGMGPN